MWCLSWVDRNSREYPLQNDSENTGDDSQFQFFSFKCLISQSCVHVLQKCYLALRSKWARIVLPDLYSQIGILNERHASDGGNFSSTPFICNPPPQMEFFIRCIPRNREIFLDSLSDLMIIILSYAIHYNLAKRPQSASYTGCTLIPRKLTCCLF